MFYLLLRSPMYHLLQTKNRGRSPTQVGDRPRGVGELDDLETVCTSI